MWSYWPSTEEAIETPILIPIGEDLQLDTYPKVPSSRVELCISVRGPSGTTLTVSGSLGLSCTLCLLIACGTFTLVMLSSSFALCELKSVLSLFRSCSSSWVPQNGWTPSKHRLFPVQPVCACSPRVLSFACPSAAPERVRAAHRGRPPGAKPCPGPCASTWSCMGNEHLSTADAPLPITRWRAGS